MRTTLVLLVGCTGASSVASDAAVDAAAGPCVPYMGQLITHPLTNIVDARLTLRSDPRATTVSRANGSFLLCTPPEAEFVVDVDLPGELMDGVIVDRPDTNALIPVVTPEMLEGALAVTGETVNPALGMVAFIEDSYVTIDSGVAGTPVRHGGAGWSTQAGNIWVIPNVVPGTIELRRTTDNARVSLPVEAGRISWSVFR